MKHHFCFGRLKSFIMRRQRLLGFIILMLFNVLFNIIIVHNQEETGKFPLNVPTPSRFFPENSTVFDFPLGNEDVFSSLLSKKEVFVMFYAPWSVQCLQAREHFEAVSSLFQDKVYFVAINCWYMGGTCKQKRNLVIFPSFHFYKQDFEDFRYMGIPRSDLLAHFVELMLDPVEVINSKEHLMSFLTRHETSAIAFFNFASTYEPVGFDQFYLTALKFIEADSANVLRFALTTNSSVASLNSLHSVSSMSLVKGSKCVNTYAFSSNASSEDIFQWININKGELSLKWLQLSRMKSLVLSNELKKGPALLLFLPYYPLSLQHEAFFEMQKVSLTYYGCNETEPIWNAFVEQLLLEDKEQTIVLQQHCRSQTLHVPLEISDKKQRKICCMFITEMWNDVCLETYAGESNPCFFFTETKFYKYLMLLYAKNSIKNGMPTCFDVQLSYSVQPSMTICSGKKRNADFGKSIRQRISYENKTYSLDPEACSKWLKYFANGWLYSNHSTQLMKEDYLYPSGFIGSGCHNNQSIRFYVLDFFENYAFINNLGFPKLSTPTLLFTDVKKEILHKFDYVSESSIVHFIMNHQKSYSIPSHFRNRETQEMKSSIAQITSSNFDEFVFDGHKMVVMLYYSKWCGFCSTFAHIFITLAEQFGHFPGLSFARVDADSNDISQKHSSPYYPAVVLFTRDNESFPYSKHNPRSLSLLIKFILHHTNQKGLHALTNLCDKECVKLNLMKLRVKLKSIFTKINLINYILSKNALDLHAQNCIKREHNKKLLQLEVAKFLFKILHQPISGNFLEKHKISFLTTKYDMYRSKLKLLPRC